MLRLVLTLKVCTIYLGSTFKTKVGSQFPEAIFLVPKVGEIEKVRKVNAR